MIDFHSHILPGIDDGSPDLETTQQLLHTLSEQGVTAVVATPHFYPSRDLPEKFLKRRAMALEQVSQLADNSPQIIPGAEVAYFSGISRSTILENLQLGSSGLLLVEMPLCPWTKGIVQDVCNLPCQTGLTPVLAHIDRYRHRKQLSQYKDILLDNGVLFQCNTEAFISKQTRRWALKFLASGYIHFLGTDTHNLTTRPPNLQEAMKIITKKLGEDTLEGINSFTEDMLKTQTGAV